MFRKFTPIPNHLSARIISLLNRFSLWHLVVMGLAIRLVWGMATETAVVSDGLSYFNHAKNMVLHGYYGFDGGESEAHWPPGYPLILSPFMMLFGANTLAVQALNFILFLVTLLGVWKLSKFYYGETIAKMAIVLLIFWPNYIYLINMSAKETVILTFISWFAYFYFTFSETNRYHYAFITGLILGIMTLVQPSIAVIAAAAVITHFVSTRRLMPSVALSVIIIVGVIVTVSPWTVRNYLLLGSPVAVSYNGGDVFYRANNANAIPGYNAPDPNSPTYHLAPLEKRAKSYELGIQWIKEHPMDFLNLAYGKGLLYLGNDDTTLWQFFEKDENSRRSIVYYALHLISNFYWIMILIFLLYGIYLSKAELDSFDHFVALAFIMMGLVEFVFEAGARHHIPLYPLMAIACAKTLLSDHKLVEDR